MSRYTNLQELADGIDHEGGLTSFLRRGFDPYEDLPEGYDDLAETACTMIYKWNEFREWAGYFEAALPEPGVGDD